MSQGSDFCKKVLAFTYHKIHLPYLPGTYYGNQLFQLLITDFAVSDDWLDRFKKRQTLYFNDVKSQTGMATKLEFPRVQMGNLSCVLHSTLSLHWSVSWSVSWLSHLIFYGFAVFGFTAPAQMASFPFFSRGLATLSEALSVGPSVRCSVTHKLKSGKTSALHALWVCVCGRGFGMGCGWELDAPAHPSMTIL